jgi:hypothetical protein
LAFREGEVVQVRYIQQLGNRLFQYCLGRIIAEWLGYALDAAPLDGFPGTALPVRGRAYERPLFRYQGHHIPFESILLDPRPRRIVLEGWFQNIRYYRAYASRIRDWLAPRPEDVSRQVGEDDHRDDVLLHVRLGDLRPAPLDLEYYRRVLGSMSFRHAYVATSEPTHPIVRALAGDGVKLVPADMGAVATLRLGQTLMGST